MTKKPNLIFDAGGVLVFPDFDLLADIAKKVGIDTSPSEIEEKHAELFFGMDEHIARYQQFPKIQYFLDIFKKVASSKEKTLAAYKLTRKADKSRHIWTTTRPWVGTSLRQLQEQSYQMAVVSNSDGRVDQILSELGLRKFFEIVVDSFIVGVEKPDPGIFNLALDQLGWVPEETIYIGDIYFIDIWGANQAGIAAIHLDSFGLYKDWDGIHIPSLKELPDLLSVMNGDLMDNDLFPARNFLIKTKF